MLVKELGRKHGFSGAAFNDRRAKFGGTQVGDASASNDAPGTAWRRVVDGLRVDALTNGLRVKCLTIVDDFTKVDPRAFPVRP